MKLVCLLITLAALQATAQQVYTIDVSKTTFKTPLSNLDLGGSNPLGQTITANSEYIIVDNKPFFPVMGEFHFSRYPNEFWEEAIQKIKAGGINVIVTYVFWNLHEPAEHVFNWKGDRDLKKFISLCAKYQMQVIVRVGPYGHGEIRNGAIPDWLYGRPIDLRTDDPAYLEIIKEYFGQISNQLKGQLYKDGGIVIGIQLENEYQHAASTWWLNYPNSPNSYTFPYSQQSLSKANTWNVERRNEYRASGDKHMQTLKRIAKDASLDVPLYTATGWGYAAIVEKGSLPVSAAYAYPSWGELEPSPFYLFKDLRKDPDYGPVRYNPQEYPSIAAEIGGGIMITNSKRPLVPANSINPLMIRNVGSGSNGIGYYMYHGGSTPVQNGQFMSEEAGELPKISYDFQAPIGEFGQVRASYHDLIPFHFFLRSYGSQLAAWPVILPATNTTVATETNQLRYALRSDGNSGFLFMHNYQDHVNTHDLTGIQLSVKTKKGTVRIPEEGSFTLKKDATAIFPINLAVGNILITYATVQPLTVFENSGTEYHVFVSIDGIQPEFAIQSKQAITAINNCNIENRRKGVFITSAGNSFRFESGTGRNKKVFLVITPELAKKAYAIKNGLVFCNETYLPAANGFDIVSRGKETDTLIVFPATKSTPTIKAAAINSINPAGKENFSAFEIHFKSISTSVKILQPRPENTVITVNEKDFDGLSDLFLRIDYIGDKGQALLSGQLVADHFYYGVPWEIGLKRFKTDLAKNPLYLYFQPLRKDASCLPYLKDRLPSFNDKSEMLQIKSVTIIPEYKCSIQLP